MKKIILPITISILALTASCSTTNYSYRSAKINGNNVLSNKTVVDTKVNLNNKIESTSSKRNTPQEAVEEAYYKAIVDNNVDFIVDPIFEVTTTDKILVFGGKSTAKLTGWGGKYSNSRSKIEAIKELSSIDTLDIKKFNEIYINSNEYTQDRSVSPIKNGLLNLFLKK